MASLEEELRSCEEQISELESKKALRNETVKTEFQNARGSLEKRLDHLETHGWTPQEQAHAGEELQGFRDQLKFIESKEMDRNKYDEQVQKALNDLYEMRTLLREMIAESQESELVEPSTSNQEEAGDMKEVELDADQLIGNRVMAPLSGVSQAIKHHSAIILDVEQEDTGKIMARLLFSFPLTPKMKPCQFFMKDSCRFEATCKFSHGELVPLEELEEYKEPDFGLVKEEALVLVPVENGIWDVGRVVLMDEDESAVKLLKTGKEVRAANSRMIPLGEEYEEHADEPSSSSRLPNTSWSELKGERHGAVTVGDLGQWTGGGFGMKMLQKMGYKLGEGLGKNSDGIVHAVQAKIYKKGKGLGESEGQFVKPKKAAISVKVNGEQESEIFSFINRKLAGKPANSEKTEAEERRKMKESSETALGTQNLSVEMEIKKMRSNEKKLIEGIQRNLKTDPKTAAKYQQRLEALRKDIGRLERQHSSIRTEQNWRREKKKEIF